MFKAQSINCCVEGSMLNIQCNNIIYIYVMSWSEIFILGNMKQFHFLSSSVFVKYENWFLKCTLMRNKDSAWKYVTLGSFLRILGVLKDYT